MALIDVRPAVARLALPAAAAAAAMGLGTFLPLVSPLLIALVLGAVLINSPWGSRRLAAAQAAVTKPLLRRVVVALGVRLRVGDLLDVGVGGLVVIVATVFVPYGATIAMGDRLGLERGLVTLVAAGYSICGAAAIAAVDDAVRDKEGFV